MDSQHTRRTHAEASNPAAWTMRWESASRNRRTAVRQLAAIAAVTALLVPLFAGAAGEQPLAEPSAGPVPTAAQQPSTAIPAGAARQLTGDPADLVSWLEQNQASTAGAIHAAADPADLVHWLEQFERTR